MPRRSAASLTVLRPDLPKRPEPPADLTPKQRKLWQEIVSSQAADYFIPGSLPLLAQLVRHVETADVLAKAINSMAGLEDDLKLANKLFAMAARESAAIAMLSVKLRLAQSARFDNKKRLPTQPAGLKPWDRFVP
jgi:hypothetical protein